MAFGTLAHQNEKLAHRLHAELKNWHAFGTLARQVNNWHTFGTLAHKNEKFACVWHVGTWARRPR